MATFYTPSVNLIGCGCVNEIGTYIKELGHQKTLLVTDAFIASSDILAKVTLPLDRAGIDYVPSAFRDVAKAFRFDPTYKELF